MVLRSSYFIFLRFLRNYIGMAILLLLPIALITVLGFLADDAVNESLGIPVKDEIVATMVLAFLMFGGFFTMEYVKGDLMSSMKWRMYALPYQPHKHAYAILISSTVFNVLQSLIIVIYTLFVYDVNWGNWGMVLLALFAVSTVIQLVYINFVLIFKNYKTAERLGTGFGLACIMLAEVWFPLPEGAIFHFLSTYSNPFSLGQNMFLAAMTGENVNIAMISLSVLVVSSIVLAISGAFFGRKRLA